MHQRGVGAWMVCKNPQLICNFFLGSTIWIGPCSPHAQVVIKHCCRFSIFVTPLKGKGIWVCVFSTAALFYSSWYGRLLLNSCSPIQTGIQKESQTVLPYHHDSEPCGLGKEEHMSWPKILPSHVDSILIAKVWTAAW